jgi:CRISPR-associated endonuclease Cas2
LRETGAYPKAKDILLILAVGTLVAASIIMPGLPKAVSYFIPKEWERYERKKLRRTIKRLRDQKLISVTEKNDEQILTLTEKGKKKVLKFKIDDLTLKKPKKWDRKWRMVIFDIPNNKKAARDLFRGKLKELGLYKLQESVFVHPYPCQGEIEFLRQIWNIQNYVKILEVSKAEEENWLKNHFGL